MIYLNPPPSNKKCQTCHRDVDDLFKTFRGSECLSAYWECNECLGLDDDTARDLRSGDITWEELEVEMDFNDMEQSAYTQEFDEYSDADPGL